MPKNSTVIEQRRKFVEWHNQSDSGLMHPNFAQAMYYYQEDSNSWHVRQNEQALKEGWDSSVQAKNVRAFIQVNLRNQHPGWLAQSAANRVIKYVHFKWQSTTNYLLAKTRSRTTR